MRKYILVFDGDYLVASMDGNETNETMKRLVKLCKVQGYLVKEVTKEEFKIEKEVAEQKELKKIMNI